MKDLARDGMTMVVVTHEMGFAREVGSGIGARPILQPHPLQQSQGLALSLVPALSWTAALSWRRTPRRSSSQTR